MPASWSGTTARTTAGAAARSAELRVLEGLGNAPGGHDVQLLQRQFLLAGADAAPKRRGRPLAANHPRDVGGIDRPRVVAIGVVGISSRATQVGHHPHSPTQKYPLWPRWSRGRRLETLRRHCRVRSRDGEIWHRWAGRTRRRERERSSVGPGAYGQAYAPQPL